jgi:hypothetical protein
MSFAISYMGPRTLAAQGCLGSIQFSELRSCRKAIADPLPVAYQGALALSSAAAVRVGNLIGAEEPKQATKAARTGLIMGFVCGCFNTVLLLLLRNVVGKAFSSDREVLQLVAEIVSRAAVHFIAHVLLAPHRSLLVRSIPILAITPDRSLAAKSLM